MKRAMTAVAAALFTAAAGMGGDGAAPARGQETARTEAAAPLDGFREALARYQAERRAGVRRRLNILHLGDSHTAGDHFAERMRTRLQERYGDGGRGQLAPGVPYRYFEPYRVEVAQTAGWQVFNSRTDPSDGPYGITGFRIRGISSEDRIRLGSREGPGFDSIEVEFLRQPQGGDIELFIDGRLALTMATAARERRPDRLVLPVPEGSREVEIRPGGNGPVDLFSWSILRGAGGVTYSAHGISGATFEVIRNWDPDVVAWQLRHLDPVLIVLAFGTNEGFNTGVDMAEYERNVDAIVRRLAGWAPNASIVLATAPDALRLPRYCARRRAERNQFECGLLTDEIRENYETRLARGDRALCRWHEPPLVQEVRDAHQRIAERRGYYFWDWSVAIPGGTCGIDAWFRQDPPLAFHDRIHLRPEGYMISADALYRRIMGGE